MPKKSGYQPQDLVTGLAAITAAQTAYNELMNKFKNLGISPKQFKTTASKPKEKRDNSYTTTTTKQQPSNTVKRTYRTAGTLRGKLPHSKTKATLFYQRHGTTYRQESGGTVTDNDSIYIGHSTCAHDVVRRSVCRALVKQIWTRAGYDIGSFEALPAVGNVTGVAMQFTYRANPDATTQMALSSIIDCSGLTYEQMAAALEAEFEATHLSSKPFEYGNLILYNPGNTAFHTEAQIDLRQVLLYFKIKSVLKVQNTTLANNIETDDSKDEISDIENNPLQGGIYSNAGGWSNALLYKDGRGGSAGTLPICVADATTGKLEFTSTAVPSSELKKPPLKSWQFGCSRYGKVVLEPGAIKYSNLNFTAQMNFNTFMEKFADSFFNPSVDYKIAFGNVALIGLEKSLSSRQASASQVRVSYQIDNTVKVASVVRRKPATNEIIEIL